MVESTRELHQSLIKDSERIKDPLNDRQIKDVLPPPARPIDVDRVFIGSKSAPDINIQLLKQWLLQRGSMTKGLLEKLIRSGGDIMKKEPNLIKVDGEVVIVGDIHGQFFDMMQMLSQLEERDLTLGKKFEHVKYLFLGDYVDRGKRSIEVCAYLLALKIKYPSQVFLLRGNHESRQMTTEMDFRRQTCYHYDEDLYEQFMELFDMLPLSAIVNGRDICMHGGLSPELKSLDQIQAINRFQEPPPKGLFPDLLWSDPVEQDEDARDVTFQENHRGEDIYEFGLKPAYKLLKENHLRCIIRAHQCQDEGYKFHYWRSKKKFPTVVIIFSAPEYAKHANQGAIIVNSRDGAVDVRQYGRNPNTPFTANDNFGGFVASFPFLVEKITEIALCLMGSIQDDKKGKAITADCDSPAFNPDKAYLKKVVDACKLDSKDNEEEIRSFSRLETSDDDDSEREDATLKKRISILENMRDDSNKQVNDYLRSVKDDSNADDFIPHEQVDAKFGQIKKRFERRLSKIDPQDVKKAQQASQLNGTSNKSFMDDNEEDNAMNGSIIEPVKLGPNTASRTLDQQMKKEMFNAVKEIDQKNERRPSQLMTQQHMEQLAKLAKLHK